MITEKVGQIITEILGQIITEKAGQTISEKVGQIGPKYSISDVLFRRSLFEHHPQFKTYEINDLSLNIKLHKT